MEGLGLCKRAAMIANADKSRAQAKTKALFLTHEMHRLHRPLREQVRSYKKLADNLQERTCSRKRYF
ncbi:hypothetical protein A9K81_00185 [Pseudomonas syringae pv. syringae]|nr:hypothetical protein A9K81_00185 [Pseudomonas syringae pv. syringae]